jgi:hypothetical protein
VDEKAFGKTLACPGCGKPVAVPQRTQPVRTASPSQRRARDENIAEAESARDLVDRPFATAPPKNVAKREMPPVAARRSADGIQNGADPSGLVRQSSTAACGWCGESIPEQALKCPHCSSWRKDIARDRDMMHVWGMLGPLVAVVFFFLGLSQEWWTEKHFLSVTWSWGKFFGSLSGLALIVWSVIAFVVSMYYGNRYNKKTGRQF